MHIDQSMFIQNVKNTFPKYFQNCSVLEVGSCNINGTIRDYFSNCNYIGIDVGEGPCVDIVCSGHQYGAPDATFDTVVSTECFEHNPFWFETFMNMVRVCKSGGLVIFTCAGEIRPEHGTAKTTPFASHLTNSIGWGNYYKNLSKEDFTSRTSIEAHFQQGLYAFIDGFSYEHKIYSRPMDLYFWGIKI